MAVSPMVTDFWNRLSPDQQTMLTEYNSLLDSLPDEAAFQQVLEKYPQLLPLRWKLNHQLHQGMVISKFPVGSLFTDFAYITKSSQEWWVVLVEIERPDKPILKKDGGFSSEYTQAKGQILYWKSIIESSDSETVLKPIRPLLRPMSDNPVRFKYMLMLGRQANLLPHGPEVIRRLRADLGQDTMLATFDSVGSHFFANHLAISGRPNVLSASGGKLRFKHLHQAPYGFFSRVACHEVDLDSSQRAQLVAWGFDMDSWEKGNLLIVNDKQSAPAGSLLDFINAAIEGAEP